jgi:hypothetical protein
MNSAGRRARLANLRIVVGRIGIAPLRFVTFI